MAIETLGACPVCKLEDRLGESGLCPRCDRVYYSLTYPRIRNIRFEEREVARKVLAFMASRQAT